MAGQVDRWVRLFASRVTQMGFGGAIRYAWQRVVDRVLRRERGAMSLSTARSVFRAYHMIDGAEVELLPGRRVPRSMNWIIPRFSIGSGGHLNIFRMIAMLEQRGFVVRIFVSEAAAFTSAGQARAIIREHFVPLHAEVHLGAGAMPPCEWVVATSWETAYWAKAFRGAQHKLYFVQDFEPYFYAHGSDYVFAEQTYRMGFEAVTAGRWLADKLAEEYGMETFPFSFSFDKGRYRPHERRSGPRRVFFYARHVTARRGFELGLLALRRLHERIPDVAFVLAGWDVSEFEIPFEYLNAGVVPLDQLPDLYSQCDVALVLSLTNLSLLPLELMACACPVVSNRGANVEWLLRDGENAVLCDLSPEALAEGLYRVLEEPGLGRKLAAGGLATAAASDWEREGQRVADYLAGRVVVPVAS